MKIFGEHDENTLAQLRDVASRAEKVALMADGHVGYVMPIGGVAAYRDQVSVVGVGFDIACGNAAIRTDLSLARLRRHRRRDRPTLNELADEIAATVSFGIGRKNQRRRRAGRPSALRRRGLGRDPGEASRGAAREGARPARHRRERQPLRRRLRRRGGRDLGRRALRLARLRSHHRLGLPGARPGRRSGASACRSARCCSTSQTPLGHDYWHLMELAGQYAYAGREWVARKVVGILGGARARARAQPPQLRLARDARRRGAHRRAQGRDAGLPGPAGFIGGSMGDDAVIVQGTPDDAPTRRRADAQRGALFSTVHGAGRVMCRTAAAGKREPQDR